MAKYIKRMSTKKTGHTIYAHNFSFETHNCSENYEAISIEIKRGGTTKKLFSENG